MPAQDPKTAPASPHEDLWRAIGLPGVMRVASYLTESLAPIYRLIVDVMLEHQPQYLSGIPHDQLDIFIRERLVQHLTGDDQTLAAVLSPNALNLDNRLAQLAGWGVIHTWEDKVRSDEDFTRHRGRYQLSEEAAHLHRAVRSLGTESSSAIAATLAPPVLATQLTQLRATIETDPAAAAAAWGVITPTMRNMSDAATGWQARLAAALSGSPDADKIATLNDTLSSYVTMWGAGIDIYSADISRDARAILAVPDLALRHVALHMAGSDTSEDVLVQFATEIVAVVGRVLSWFDGPTSQAGSLRRQMRDTIVPMVRGKRALAAVGGHVSRRNELLNLAERLDRSSDDDEAWHVWTTYTGLFSARHLGPSAPHPGHGSDALSFWEAAPAPVEARLRRLGPRSGRSGPSRMYDRTAGKQAARQTAIKAAREETRTWERLLALSGNRLSQWNDLSDKVAEHLTEFVMVLDSTIAEMHRNDAHDPAPGTVVRARTGDGLWDLSATVPPVGTPDAVIPLPEGRLVYRDLTVSITRAVDAPSLTGGIIPASSGSGDTAGGSQGGELVVSVNGTRR
jgi:uncharacterized protein (TIGR02677 family)